MVPLHHFPSMQSRMPCFFTFVLLLCALLFSYAAPCVYSPSFIISWSLSCLFYTFFPLVPFFLSLPFSYVILLYILLLSKFLTIFSPSLYSFFPFLSSMTKGYILSNIFLYSPHILARWATHD